MYDGWQRGSVPRLLRNVFVTRLGERDYPSFRPIVVRGQSCSKIHTFAR